MCVYIYIYTYIYIYVLCRYTCKVDIMIFPKVGVNDSSFGGS